MDILQTPVLADKPDKDMLNPEDSDNDDFLVEESDEEETPVFEIQNYLFLFDKELNFSKKALSAQGSKAAT